MTGDSINFTSRSPTSMRTSSGKTLSLSLSKRRKLGTPESESGIATTTTAGTGIQVRALVIIWIYAFLKTNFYVTFNISRDSLGTIVIAIMTAQPVTHFLLD